MVEDEIKYEKELLNVGIAVLSHTMLLTSNVLVFKRENMYWDEGDTDFEDKYSAGLIQDITYAIHNLPRSIHQQDEDFILRELGSLYRIVGSVNFDSIPWRNKHFFTGYCSRIIKAVQPYVKVKGE
ncbi:hypothetical protein FT641_18480 [Bacillus paranthracis]|uniref:hypothetical protein n=1 Tax=Bacillus paranthracis TaxID=2026186 RepID=UPI00187A0F28|nr:hypothetical protein [Bacillus paranthracis]MBE7114449.1 hypothetical protein [Bacillus paranthracis]MBE7154677.1 hypothetical protein [Bacillus paranthracis]